VIAGRAGRAIGSRPIHRDRQGAGRGEAHGEDSVGGAGVTFGQRDVVDGELRQSVVIGDGDHTLSIVDGGVGGVAQVHEERFIGLVERVAVDNDSDRSGGLSGGDSERARVGQVIAGRAGSAIGSRPIHRNRQGAGRGEAHGEDSVSGASVAFGQRDVVDGKLRQSVVVSDDYHTLNSADAGVGGVAQV